MQEQKAKQYATGKKTFIILKTVLNSPVDLTSLGLKLCTKNYGINNTHLHSENVAIEFYGFISVSNLEDEM